MAKYKIIKRYKKWKTGEVVEIGTIVDVKEDRIETFKKLGLINRPVREKRTKEKKE